MTDLMALQLNWIRGDTPIDELEGPQEQARTAAYAFRMFSRGLRWVQRQTLFPVIWEERMCQDLEELRAELGIEAEKAGPRSWCQNELIMAAVTA